MLVGAHEERAARREAEGVGPPTVGVLELDAHAQIGVGSLAARAHDEHGSVEWDQVEGRTHDSLAADPTVREPSSWSARRAVRANRVDAVDRLVPGGRLTGAVAVAELQPEHVEVSGLVRDGIGDARAAVGVGEDLVHVGAGHFDIGVGAERDRDFDELHGVREARVRVPLRNGSTLAFVGIEQRGVGLPMLDGGQLPREVVGILHAGV